MSDRNILDELNDIQRDAVTMVDGPVMVIAGAGSGKTRVLTYRIAHMLENGISPWSILALTFTNKAAKEMQERILKLIGDEKAKAVQMGTFHSVFLRILRTEAKYVGFQPQLTIYDTEDSKSLLRNIIKEMQLDPKIYVVNYVLNRISMAKSNLMSAEIYAQSTEAIAFDQQNGKPLIHEIFTRYNNRMKAANAMDFDDLLYYTHVLLRDNPDVLLKYQNRFRFVLVDEYQDTNFAQYSIIKKIVASHHNICVVGDDAQSIYGFRGADINNILNFKRDYPEAKIIKLEQNYRSTQNIVNVANTIIKNNKKQIPKDVWTDNEVGEPIRIIATQSDNNEAKAICDSIHELKNNLHIDYKEIAILYRTNMQSRAIEEELIKKHIPYKIFGGTSFYARKEIKDVLAYCRLCINPYDEESLRRIINYPARGIGDTTLEKVIVCAHESRVRLWDVIANPNDYPLAVNAGTKAKLADFATKIKSFTAQLSQKNAYEMGKMIAYQSGIVTALKADPSEKDRLENLEELIDSMQNFVDNAEDYELNEMTGEIIENFVPTLDRFLEHISLLTDIEKQEDEEADQVKLMTIHSAKGLEFDYVYLAGLEENLFPSALSVGSRTELEEERRLFYVAITRAKRVLSISYAQMRYRFGNQQFCEPSRFLDEIPASCVKSIKKASSGTGYFATQQKRTAVTTHFASQRMPSQKPTTTLDTAAIGKVATVQEIVPNIRVYHSKFGYGVVQRCEGAGTEKKAVVIFDTLGEKTLILKFAKLILPKS